MVRARTPASMWNKPMLVGRIMFKFVGYLCLLLLMSGCSSREEDYDHDDRGRMGSSSDYKPFWDGHRYGWYR